MLEPNIILLSNSTGAKFYFRHVFVSWKCSSSVMLTAHTCIKTSNDNSPVNTTISKSCVINLGYTRLQLPPFRDWYALHHLQPVLILYVKKKICSFSSSALRNHNRSPQAIPRKAHLTVLSQALQGPASWGVVPSAGILLCLNQATLHCCSLSLGGG